MPQESRVETFVTGLISPWAIDSAPDGRFFVTERQGNIRVIDQGRLRAQPWLVLDVAASGEAGLMGPAIDPEFA